MAFGTNVKATVAELIALGWPRAKISRETGVGLRTVVRWAIEDDEITEMVELRRHELLDRCRANIKHLAFDESVPHSVQLRATLELLRHLDPAGWEPTYRRRVHEAELSYNYNPRVQYQKYLDERDARIQAENARKALEDSQEEEDPEKEMGFRMLLEDLRQRRLKAGAEAEKQADDYRPPERSNGFG